MVVRVKKLLLIIALLCVALCFGAYESHAEAEIEYDSENIVDPGDMFNGSRYNYAIAKENNVLRISCSEGIKSIYMELDKLPEGVGTIKNVDTGETKELNPNLFLHYYENFEELFGNKPKKVEINFPAELCIERFYAFSDEEGDFVQKWEPMLEKADLVLFSTHSDDEQLFFAGLLPYYSIERGYRVQVVYFTNHFTTQWGTPDRQRPHEQLDGLWTVGIKNYPDMSTFRDLYGMRDGRDPKTTADAMAYSFKYYANIEREELLGFMVKSIRKFKPLVVVGHDVYGEYGHAAHVLATQLLFEALEICDNEGQYSDSAKEYGVWKPEKVYIHSYTENPIVMDWDTPYDSMGGKTPFQLTQDGFRCHPSQHYPMFTQWLYGVNNEITKATQIVQYSPCNYGLYYTSVGPDVKGGDMFENVKTYGQQEAEEEARKKAEEEEAARRKAEEEAKRKAEEEARIAAEQAAEDARLAARRERIRIGVIAGGTLSAVSALLFSKKKKK